MTDKPQSSPTRRDVLRVLGVAALAGVGATAGCKQAGTDARAHTSAHQGDPSTSSSASGGSAVAGSDGPANSGARPTTPHATTPHASSPHTSSPRPTAKPQPAPTVRRGTLLGAGSHAEDGRRRTYVSLIDLDQPVLRPRTIETGFFGHGVAFDPIDPSRALLFEKHGPGCCELDLVAGKLRHRVPTTPERQFYGHGVFTADGRLLLATETIVGDGSKRGVIVVRDGRTLKPLGTFPSYGEAPHDCRLIDEGRTLVVTNGGGTHASGHVPNVAYIDVATRQLKERVPFDTPRVNAGHLAISRGGDLVVVSAPRDGLDLKASDVHGAISFRPAGASGMLKTAKVALINRMRAETLSVAIQEKLGVVAATSPGGNLVSFWDLKTGKLMSTLDTFAQPRGVTVTLDGAFFALTWGGGASLALIDTKTLRPLPGGSLKRAWMSGSHVYVHPLRAKGA